VERVRVNSDYLIEIPPDIREKLGIEPGDVLRVEIREGSVLLIPDQGSYVDRFQSYHPEIWDGVDPLEYVRQEREDWQKT
jgi:AbrB family looped-hinge helix DNA binding protein